MSNKPISGLTTITDISNAFLTGIDLTRAYGDQNVKISAALLNTGTASLAAPTLTTLGGVEAILPVAHKFMTSIGTTGVAILAQPLASDISGLANVATTGSYSSLSGTPTLGSLAGLNIPSSGLIGSNGTTLSNVTLAGAIYSNGTLAITGGSSGVVSLTTGTGLTGGTILTSGTISLAAPSASTIGGVKAISAQIHQFLTSIGIDGTPTLAQPAVGDISGIATVATSGSYTDLANKPTIGALAAMSVPAAGIVVSTGSALSPLTVVGATLSGTTLTIAGAAAVTSVVAGTGLTGGTITSTGTLSLAAPSLTNLGGVIAIAPVAHQFITSVGTNGVHTLAQPSVSDISGVGTTGLIYSNGTILTPATIVGATLTSGILTIPSAVTSVTAGVGLSGGPITSAGTLSLAAPSASTLGGVKSIAAQTHKFLTSIGIDGTPTLVQPAAADITGLATVATSGSYTDLINIPTIPATGLVYSTGTILAAAIAGNGITFNAGTISSSRAGLPMQVVRPFDGNSVMTTGTFLVSPSLPYGIGNVSLVVNPGTGTATVNLLNNGTVVGSAITATGTQVSSGVMSGVTLVTGSSLGFSITGASANPMGYIMVSGTYTGS